MARSLSIPDMKLLFARSGNQCAFPECDSTLVEGQADSEATVTLGEAAHIVGFSPRGPRGEHARENVNSAQNHLLLCEKHHKIVDRRPGTYTPDILLAMKHEHENGVANRMGRALEPLTVTTVEEVVPSSLIRFEKMPKRIYSAPLLRPNAKESEVAREINYSQLGEAYCTFLIREQTIYSFNNLPKLSGTFGSVADVNGCEVFQVEDLLDDPEWQRRYVRLLNLGLGKHLRAHQVIFDRNHDRYYFRTEAGRERSVLYRTTSGKRSKRSVVWNPITKATGQGKKFWWHLAAGLRFDCYGPDFWCLAIRPERHITLDGSTPYPALKIGKKITSLKARLYNDKYLDELVFWRDLLSGGRPEIILPFGSQACVAQAKLLDVRSHWPEIGDVSRVYEAQPHEPDLFSLADIDELTGDDDE